MSDARSTYDESNEVWPYFLLTVLGVVLVPMTVGQLIPLLASSPKTKIRSASHAQFRANVNRKRLLSSGKLWFVVFGWAVVAYLIAFLRSVENTSIVETPETWDPYAILHVATSASLKEIRSAYRKLSLEFHPDKVKDVAESAKEQVEATYVEISKAYRALTDEITRENYLLYGHPDGPQPTVHGIALPAFLFDPAASFSFIATYLLGFGVGIPLIVGKWWVNSQKRTRKGLLQATATRFCELLAKEQAHFITREHLMKLVLMAPDMDESLASRGMSSMAVTLMDRQEALKRYLRRKMPQSQLELLIATETARLLMGIHEIAALFRSYILCQRVLELRRSIIQAIPFDMVGNAELAQLRGIDIEEIILGKVDPDSLIGAIDRARDYVPRLHLLDATFRVMGETKVTPSSQIHLEIKFLVAPLGSEAPYMSSTDVHPESESVGVQTGFRDPALINTQQPKLPDALAPYFPEDVQTSWYVYLYGERDNKLLEKPLEVTNMNLHNLSLSKESFEEGHDVVVGTIVLPISSATPPTPETIPLRVAVVSSCYFGADIRTPVIMEVEAASEPSKQDHGVDDDGGKDEESDEDVEGLSDVDTSSEEEDNAADD